MSVSDKFRKKNRMPCCVVCHPIFSFTCDVGVLRKISGFFLCGKQVSTISRQCSCVAAPRCGCPWPVGHAEARTTSEVSTFSRQCSCVAALGGMPLDYGGTGYPFNSARLHCFNQTARQQNVPTPERSFRFPRRGRPESPRPRHLPKKMRSRHCASLGRNDTCRYLSRAGWLS